MPYVGRASDRKYFAQLSNVSIALEDRLSEEELCQDASTSPDVYRLSVKACAVNDLWRLVPPRRHTFGHLSLRLAIVPCQTEIREFAVSIDIHENIWRLEILDEDIEPYGESSFCGDAELREEFA